MNKLNEKKTYSKTEKEKIIMIEKKMNHILSKHKIATQISKESTREKENAVH